MNEMEILNELIERYPSLKSCKEDIFKAYKILEKTYESDHKLLVCGNGGSCADSDHIVGELMKSFCKKRTVSAGFLEKLRTFSSENAEDICTHLEGALPAIALTNHNALQTAFGNDKDNGFLYQFAQQVYGYGNENDTLIGISTSGNSKNVVNACLVAKAKGLFVIGLTGSKGGKLKDICDVTIRVPSDITHHIQELHLPIYHCLCLMLEERFF